MQALEELTDEYHRATADEEFQKQLAHLSKTYVGRPNPLYFAERLTERCGGARIYLKREDLNHTGAHKINNTIGQALLCERMGKRRIIAETGAGQHGVATATACARFGFECIVYMGEEDIRRQKLNVFNMKAMGAEVRAVTSGSRTLRDAVNEALRDWMGSVANTHYIIGSVVGPHPFPMIVRDFQAVIGRETKEQCLDQIGRLPDEIVACVGGGSNAAGMFYPFVDEKDASYTRALDNGFQVSGLFSLVRELTTDRESPVSVPLVAMVSYAIVYRVGREEFLSQARDAGFAGMIVPDLPGDEADEFAAMSQAAGLDLIQLISPTTPLNRAEKILKLCRGFVYCVSVAGTTGVRDRLPEELNQQLKDLRTKTDLPLCVGFGVNSPGQLDTLRGLADGAIVGSAIVRQLEGIASGESLETVAKAIGEFAGEMVQAAHTSG
eukprot:g22052.t1